MRGIGGVSEKESIRSFSSSQEGSSSDKESCRSLSGSEKEGSLSRGDIVGGSMDHPQNPQMRQKVEMLPGIAEESLDVLRARRKAEWDAGWDALKPEDVENLKPLTDAEMMALGTPVEENLHDVDPKLWDKYLQEVEESEGFDVFTDPGRTPYKVYAPITYYNRLKELEETLIGLAKQALAEKLPGYEFVAIEWVTGYPCAGWVYKITFRARGADAPEGKSFQAHVYDGIDKVKVYFCRPKVVKT